jgi:hypothetical protein
MTALLSLTVDLVIPTFYQKGEQAGTAKTHQCRYRASPANRLSPKTIQLSKNKLLKLLRSGFVHLAKIRTFLNVAIWETN